MTTWRLGYFFACKGIVKKITKPNLFKPENDIKNNIWYSLKLEDLESFTGYKLNNFILFLQNSQSSLIKNKPKTTTFAQISM